LKPKPPEYLSQKTDCPARDYDHHRDLWLCYARTYYHGKSVKRVMAPICQEGCAYCEWNNPNREVSYADREKQV